jgi:hypothetical protein
MKTIKTQGTYRVKDTDEEVSYSFEYPVIDSVQDAIDNIGEDKVLSLCQRMLKIDANNVAREKARVKNGHSTRQPLTEEQKAENKAKRQADKELLALIKSKNLTLADLENI